MSPHNQQIGAWGEGVAVDYLIKGGFEIVARNIRTPYGEIDILASKGDVFVFVEVKTLTSSGNFLPEHKITPRKRETMLSAASYHAAENGIDHWQIDVIAIEGKPPGRPVVTHFENAV